jgi:hypothetical protein
VADKVRLIGMILSETRRFFGRFTTTVAAEFAEKTAV